MASWTPDNMMYSMKPEKYERMRSCYEAMSGIEDPAAWRRLAMQAVTMADAYLAAFPADSVDDEAKFREATFLQQAIDAFLVASKEPPHA